MNTAQLMIDNLERFGEYTYVTFKDRRATNAETILRAQRLATVLRNKGIGAGDRVVVMMPNCPEVMEAFHAIWRIGAVISPFTPKLGSREVGYQIEDSGAVAAIASSDTAPVIAEATAGIDGFQHLLVFGPGGVDRAHDITGEVASAEPFEHMVDLDPDDMAVLLYTSGTTGNPKGVMLSHRSTAFNAEALSRRNRSFEPGSKTLAVLPLSHGYGVLMMNTWSIWGASIHVLPQWDVAAAFEAIQRHRIQHLSLVPTMFSDMVSFPDRERFDTSSLETSGSGGAFLPDDLRLEFERTFGVMVRDGYGMTEYCSVVCCYDFEDDPHRPGSVGTPIDDTEVRIVDFNGNDVPAGVDGELLVRGACTMTGYWNKEEATRTTIRDGWVHSGDVAHLDEDGYIYITGRTKDLIIKGGENISPKELEEAIQEHPAVAVVAVIGVPHERYGEDICAVVLRMPGATVTEDEIKSHASDYVTKFKVPSHVVFLDEMPTTHSGKVQKNKLRELVAERLID